VRRGRQRQRHAAARGLRSPEPALQDALRTPAAGRMSLSLLFLIFCSHLIHSAWAHGEKRLTPEGQPAPPRNPGDSSGSRGRSSATFSSSSASSPVAASPGSQGSGSEHSSFQWSPSGRRTGSLYCRVGIGFHLQIYPDGKVNGSHEASVLSKLLTLQQNLFWEGRSRFLWATGTSRSPSVWDSAGSGKSPVGFRGDASTQSEQTHPSVLGSKHG
jgi:hypothetical protein